MVVVEGDNVLFAGDIVMNHRFLAFGSPYTSLEAWLSVLDQLAPLRPARIVPCHGPMGDGSLIAMNRTYLKAVQDRVAELKGQGKSAEETSQLLTDELRAKYPDWTGPNGIGAAAKVAYNEAR